LIQYVTTVQYLPSSTNYLLQNKENKSSIHGAPVIFTQNTGSKYIAQNLNRLSMNDIAGNNKEHRAAPWQIQLDFLNEEERIYVTQHRDFVELFNKYNNLGSKLECVIPRIKRERGKQAAKLKRERPVPLEESSKTTSASTARMEKRSKASSSNTQSLYNSNSQQFAVINSLQNPDIIEDLSADDEFTDSSDDSSDDEDNASHAEEPASKD